MFEEKLKIVKKYLEDNLEKRFIIANRLFFASSVTFLKKTNEIIQILRRLSQIESIDQAKQILVIADQRNASAFEKN